GMNVGENLIRHDLRTRSVWFLTGGRKKYYSAQEQEEITWF
ncbi:MAG: hypothetical protein ACJATF_004473, partial [Flavobacteriales bacterium]